MTPEATTAPPRRGWRAQARAFFRQLWQEHTEPGRVALALLVGAMIGCTPLFGLHIVVCIATAWLLGLNQLIVYGAANLSIPPLVPLVGFVSVQLGERLLHGHWAHVARADFHLSTARAMATRYFVDWMVGGLLFGALVGSLGGIAFYVAHSARRRRRPEEQAWRRLIVRATERYRGLHPRFYWYARMKFQMDPCYQAIVAQVPSDASIVDLGSGLGMLPLLLALDSPGRQTRGIEWDAAKVACGRHAVAGLSAVTLDEGDLRTAALPECDVVTLVDVLHYYDAAVQHEILLRCKKALRPAGRLLIREGDGARRGGAGITRLIERAMVRCGWNRAAAVRFLPIDQLVAELQMLGFVVEQQPVAGTLHPGNVLLVARLA